MMGTNASNLIQEEIKDTPIIWPSKDDLVFGGLLVCLYGFEPGPNSNEGLYGTRCVIQAVLKLTSSASLMLGL